MKMKLRAAKLRGIKRNSSVAKYPPSLAFGELRKGYSPRLSSLRSQSYFGGVGHPRSKLRGIRRRRIKGKVVRGRGIGAKLGYPTANIKCSGCPGPGVYSALVDVGEKSYRAAAVVKNDLIEVLLFNFSGDLYGQELEIELFKKVSEIEKFDNEGELIEKIKNDIKLCSQE